MASLLPCRTLARAVVRPTTRPNVFRALTTTSQPPNASSSSSTPPPQSPQSSHPTISTSDHASAPNTHFKITLRRSAISLGDKIKGTLKALGFHRRFQTVYFPFSPEVAGKILRVKELVEVENVPAHRVRTSREQRLERKAPRGYKVVGSKKGRFLNV